MTCGYVSPNGDMPCPDPAVVQIRFEPGEHGRAHACAGHAPLMAEECDTGYPLRVYLLAANGQAGPEVEFPSAPLPAEFLPRCAAMDGSGLSVVRQYTEAGYYQEAHAVALTDGERSAIYAPVRLLPPAAGPAERVMSPELCAIRDDAIAEHQRGESLPLDVD